ncbi:unnamed protein product [Mytilus edulis]|uniref:Uncharacterized protein n=1 Tax=Mytilus edulis TaxID=6550 RepID=A0A8S3UXQ2_MYTED|nr:unnamed protein product [Mytilus edulis]
MGDAFTASTNQDCKMQQTAFRDCRKFKMRLQVEILQRRLDTHQVLGLLRHDENKTKARGLFSGQVKPLAALALRQMMVFKYSEGNRRLGEMRTGQGFLTFLQAASKKTDKYLARISLHVTPAESNQKRKSIARSLMMFEGYMEGCCPCCGCHTNPDEEINRITWISVWLG